jgi:hypothetical protein
VTGATGRPALQSAWPGWHSHLVHELQPHERDGLGQTRASLQHSVPWYRSAEAVRMFWMRVEGSYDRARPGSVPTEGGER